MSPLWSSTESWIYHCPALLDTLNGTFCFGPPLPPEEPGVIWPIYASSGSRKGNVPPFNILIGLYSLIAPFSFNTFPIPRWYVVQGAYASISHDLHRLPPALVDQDSEPTYNGKRLSSIVRSTKCHYVLLWLPHFKNIRGGYTIVAPPPPWSGIFLFISPVGNHFTRNHPLCSRT